MPTLNDQSSTQTSGDTLLGPLPAAGETASRLSRRGVWTIRFAVGFVIFVCMALLIMNAWLIVRARTAEVAQITKANFNLAHAVSQQVEGSFAMAEHIVSGIVFDLERAVITVDTLASLQPILVNHVSQIASIKGLFVYDAEGRWVVNSEASDNINQNNSDRDYFIFHRGNQSARTLISAPIISRSSGEWIIPISQRISDPDGKFAGVVLATLSIKNLVSDLDKFQIGEKGAIAIFKGNQILLRRPLKAFDLEKRPNTSPLMKVFQSSRSGTTEGVSTIDGVERIISFEHLINYPLFVTVAAGKDEALDEWRTLSIYQTSWVISLCAILGIMGFYLIKVMRRQVFAEQRLLTTRDALTEANEHLAHLAKDDALTGLSNRRYFDARLLRSFREAQETQKFLSIIMIDVDQFKKYNDLYGHMQGDKCLKQVADALRSVLRRPADFIARYGGEEMVMLLPDTDVDGAANVAERARLAIYELQLPHAGTALGVVSVSLGVATCIPTVNTLPADLLQASDQMLYQAKNFGRNNFKTCSL